MRALARCFASSLEAGEQRPGRSCRVKEPCPLPTKTQRLRCVIPCVGGALQPIRPLEFASKVLQKFCVEHWPSPCGRPQHLVDSLVDPPPDLKGRHSCWPAMESPGAGW